MEKLKMVWKEDANLRRLVILGGIALVLIIGAVVSWNTYFSKYLVFQKQEKRFLEAVERYYSFNKQYLPKKLETREMTLEELYKGDRIETLYVPKTKKLCDSNNSWVRIYQTKDGKYEYRTYLKCGRFESKIDHTGPEIVLNGDSAINISLGDTYEELGIKSVIDKEEGKLDSKNVVIDSSKVDTSKVGSYKVTYTIRDKAYNRTVVTRKVNVLQSLTDTVRNNTNETNYYRGVNPNNYILFSGMLWRIVGLDSEGNVKIVTNDGISNITYGNDGVSYNDSNIQTWLNDYFYKSLNNADKYIKKDSKWCIDNVSSVGAITGECTTYSSNHAVGLMSLYDFQMSRDNGATYLNTITEYWLMNKKDDRFGYIHSFFNSNLITTNESTSISAVRPVINLNKGLYVITGDGSIEKPYKLGDYNYGKENDLLKTRLIGEHVTYFGMSFRISDVDKDGNIKLVSTGYLRNNTTGDFIYDSYKNKDSIKKFDPSEKGNIGYALNNDYIDYIDQKLIVSHKFERPIYDSTKKYSEFKKEEFEAKISIPSSYELFSATNDSMTGQANYWLIDYIPDGKTAFMTNSQNGRTFIIDDSIYNSNGFKLVFYVRGSTKISGGRGTVVNPYYIK